MHYDVIVCGGGPAGFGAAIGAVRTGKKVLLLDKNSGPGGVAVYCGCPVFSGIRDFNAATRSGIAGEFAQAMEKDAFIVNNITMNSSEFAIGQTMTEMLKTSGVDMLFYATLHNVRLQGNRIKEITVCACGRNYNFSAENFVDATGDAVLSRLAGAEILPYRVEETMTKTVLFRVSGVKDFDKPKLMELFPKLDFPLSYQNRFMGTIVGDGQEILLNLTAVSGDALDAFELTRMDIELREQIPVVLEWIKKKLPGFENCRLSAVAPVIGVRSSCNIKGKEVITCDDLDNNTPVTEPVARGSRSYGEHYIHSFNSPWRKANDGSRAIPYGALLPEKLENLCVGGRCISIETRAVTAVRLMPVCMATGQAAGIAAALGIPEYSKVKIELQKQKCHI